MGVKNLASFIRSLEDGIRSINVLDEIKNSGIKQPLVVIDLLTIVGALSGAAGDHIYGCRNQFALPKAARFCDSLINAGARLVFFIDGRLQEAKYNHWLARQDDVYANSLRLLGVAERQRCKVEGNVTRQSFVTALIATARTKGRLYTTYDFECDKEVAAFCNEFGAFAVITNDSDYLMFRGDWRIWCSSSLSITTMCTEEWNKTALWLKLGLEWQQMPFVAGIAGNDYFQGNAFEEDFEVVAKRVSDLDLKLGETQITTDLCEILFDTRDENVRKSFEDSVTLYDLNFEIETPFVPPYMRTYPNSAISVLLDIPGAIRLPGLDLRDDCYSQIALQIYRRQLGVLLQSSNDDDRQPRVFMKEDHCTPYGIVDVIPLYPPYIVPSLQQLYSSSMDSYIQLYPSRKKLLCWMVSKSLKPDQIDLFPSTYLVDVLTLYFLVENEIINEASADIILLVIYHYMQDRIPTCLRRPRFPRKSNLRIGLSYVLFYTYFYFCAEIVGLIQPLVSSFFCKFDAVYFHMIAEDSLYDPATVQFYLRPIGHLRIYAKENRASRSSESFTV